MISARRTSTYALAAIGIYLTGDILHWGLRRWSIAPEAIGWWLILLAELLAFVVVAVALALRPSRYPILTSGAVSGAAVFTLWVAKVPLTFCFQA